jgi:hypothetical protein
VKRPDGSGAIRGAHTLTIPPTSRETSYAAAVHVCAVATDPDDAERLLDMLGLLEALR